jgi:hypothetical protein
MRAPRRFGLVARRSTVFLSEMAEALSETDGPLAGNPPEAGARTALDRLAAFRVVYAAIFAFVLLSVVSVWAAEGLLTRHFRNLVNQAILVSPANGPIAFQVQSRVRAVIHGSPWTRLAGVEVDAIVIGADGTIIYSGGRALPPPPTFDPIAVFREAQQLLPASAETFVAVPISSLLVISILVGYGAVLVTGLFFQNRSVARREEALLRASVEARDRAAERAGAIERELEEVRVRLLEVEPAERARAGEIRELQSERQNLQHKLMELAEREEKLRTSAERSIELEEERRALEDLLEEAMEDLGQKDEEIQTLQGQLKRAAKAAPSGGRSRSAAQLARRMHTLYKNLEIDDHAISDMVALGDEAMRLKAEEGIKRLAEESDNAAIRRKVGGLPPQLSIFELGFAGKGRIYYTRGAKQRFRILAIGAKNTQKTDLEYLSRLPA